MGTTQKRRGCNNRCKLGRRVFFEKRRFLERVTRTFASANAIPHTERLCTVHRLILDHKGDIVNQRIISEIHPTWQCEESQSQLAIVGQLGIT